jgi:diguanylate cyclase (GGDEF)-like protein
MLELNHFKQLNDHYGHRAGRSTLRTLGGLLAGGKCRFEMGGRYGEETFLIPLPEHTAIHAHHYATKLRAQILATKVPLEEDQAISMSISIGIAAFPEHGTTLKQLITSAEQALRRQGRGASGSWGMEDKKGLLRSSSQQRMPGSRS